MDSSLFTQVIGKMPYPVAVFKHNGVLSMANQVLMKEAGIDKADISAGKINFLGRVTDENYAVLEAAADTFLGESTMLSRLSYPLGLFCADDNRTVAEAYHSAVFFPITSSDGHIPFGAVMLMK